MFNKMKKDNKIDENHCEMEGCGCNVNYLLLGVAVIFIVMIVASTIK
jgi:hypothetical protein